MAKTMLVTSFEPSDRLYKRPLDLAILVLAHIVLLPAWVVLWTLIPLAIWLEDRGPVFYRQKRMGRHGKVFTLLKFRSLVPNADQTVRSWEVPQGSVVSRVGRVLRSTAMDELPQVLSILKGDMSFFGPRAMPVDEYHEFVKKLPELRRRLSVRPGLTGLAQVRAQASRDNARKLRYDLEYIECMSLWLDLKLLVTSLWNTLLGRWETPRADEAGYSRGRSHAHNPQEPSREVLPGNCNWARNSTPGMEARRVLKNRGRLAYAPVILRKLKSRAFERPSKREMELNLLWLDDVSEEFEPLAKALDADLWSESRAFGKRLRECAERKLRELDVHFGGGGYYELLYFITRHLRPRVVVETGVAAGFSTQAFLKAMEVNHQGRLHSSDFPYIKQFRLENYEQHIGILVEEKLRGRWELYLEGDRKNLPRIVAKVPEIDIFHYDSEKWYSGREFALSTISEALVNDGIIIMDDIQDDSFFRDYVEGAGWPWNVFKYSGKYVGALGIRRLSRR